MKDYTQNTEALEDDVISALIRLPVSNLEKRIALFESQISKRRKLSDLLLTKLGTKRLWFEDDLHRSRYSSLSGGGSSREQRTKQDLLQIEDQIGRELTGCFNDIIKLEDQRQRANEELTNAREKFKIIENT